MSASYLILQPTVINAIKSYMQQEKKPGPSDLEWLQKGKAGQDPITVLNVKDGI